jgi:hypothetical protein
MYFYGDGTDKSGNRLITSYGKRAQAEKYRAGAKISEGLRFLQINEDGSAQIAQDGDLLLRTLIVAPAQDEQVFEGPFVVYAKIGGQWQKTKYRYKTYSAANTAVKGALVQIYGACAVIEETEENDGDNADSQFLQDPEAF